MTCWWLTAELRRWLVWFNKNERDGWAGRECWRGWAKRRCRPRGTARSRWRRWRGRPARARGAPRSVRASGTKRRGRSAGAARYRRRQRRQGRQGRSGADLLQSAHAGGPGQRELQWRRDNDERLLRTRWRRFGLGSGCVAAGHERRELRGRRRRHRARLRQALSHIGLRLAAHLDESRNGFVG